MNFLLTQYSRKYTFPGKIELKISFTSYHFSYVRGTILLQRHRLGMFPVCARELLNSDWLSAPL